MSYSGDAAEQVVRMSLETGDVAIRLAGSGAKQLAILLYAILREQKKTRGKTRLANMLRSGKELKVFAVKDSDLKLFCREAKKYGVLYCVLKDRDATDGITDLMVRAEDASKINRIFERFNLSTVDMAEIRSEIERNRETRQEDAPEMPAADEPMADQEIEELLDTMLSSAPEQEGRNRGPFFESPQDQEISRGGERGDESSPPYSWERSTAELAAMSDRDRRSRQSEPTSRPKEQPGPDTSDPRGRTRPSVRQELNEIKAEQRQKAEDRAKSPQQKPAQHKAPPKKKARKQKER